MGIKNAHSLTIAVFSRKLAFKAIVLSAFVCLSFGGQSFAVEAPEVLGDEGTEEFLQEKPLDTPTPDYLNSNNVKIPQKDGTSVFAPESAYKIVAGSADDNTFIYKTVDENGNIKGWQPYVTVGVVWNAMNSGNVTADGGNFPK